MIPNLGTTTLDPHASLQHAPEAAPFFTEAQLKDTVTEIAQNYQVSFDPESSEANPRHFGTTIVNKDLLDQGIPAILVVSTSRSSLYDVNLKPANEGNALELAYTALKYPDQPVVYIESPGNGNSSDLSSDEYAQALEDGKLVHESRDLSGRINNYEAFETLQAMARALRGVDVRRISHISSNASGVHFSGALAVALPNGDLERFFGYNPSNISDRNPIALAAGNLLEIITQGKYAKASKDPLKLTEERKTMAREVMTSVKQRPSGDRVAKKSTVKRLASQNRIFSRGNRRGQSAAVHAAVVQMAHPNALQTYVFPEFAAQYKSPEDFAEFIRLIGVLGGVAVHEVDLESLRIPIGQYGHSHFPSVRQTLEAYAYHRR